MGYSRVDSQLLSRALCTWTFTGFANAGIGRLDGHESHTRPTHGLANSLCIIGIVLVTLHIRFYKLWGD